MSFEVMKFIFNSVTWWKIACAKALLSRIESKVIQIGFIYVFSNAHLAEVVQQS